MFSIRTNVASLGAQRNLSNTGSALGKSMERLSSGFRINRAADDAAGLAISEKLKGQISGLNQAARNAMDGISMIQTAEAGLDEVQNIMQRMRELAVQGANDTLGSSERDSINEEIKQLRTELQNISERTTFNGRGILSGALATSLDTTGTGLQAGTDIGATAGELQVSALDVGSAEGGESFTLTANGGNIEIQTADITDSIKVSDLTANGSQTLNFAKFGFSITVTNYTTNTVAAADVVSGLDTQTVDTLTTTEAAVLQTGAYQGEETRVSFLDTRIEDSAQIAGLKKALDDYNGDRSQTNSAAMISAVDNALESISTSRAKLGAVQNRLEHTIKNVKAGAENLSASNSRIRDVDVAAESATMAKNQVLMQAGVSVLSQANQMQQLALKLLG